jgi:hypothetical protein
MRVVVAKSDFRNIVIRARGTVNGGAMTSGSGSFN